MLIILTRILKLLLLYAKGVKRITPMLMMLVNRFKTLIITNNIVII